MTTKDIKVRESLAVNWWAYLGRGIIAVLFGLAAIGWPNITVLALYILIGIYLLVDGALAIGAAYRANRSKQTWWPYALEALGAIALGVLVFAIPDITARILLLFLGIWLIGVGIMKAVLAIEYRKEIRGEWLLVLVGGLQVLVGAFLVAFPREGALAMITIIGLGAIVYGAMLAALGLNLYYLQQAITEAAHVSEEERKRAA